MCERPCDKMIQTAEQADFQKQKQVKASSLMTVSRKRKEHGVKTDPDGVRIAAGRKERIDKSVSHFSIWKPDRDIQRQIAWL